MPAPLDASGSVELVVVERDGVPESRHLGAAVLVDADGHVVEAWGDASRLIFPRSAAKPLQATAMLRLGASLSDAHLAIAQASHAGAPVHVALVDEILAGAGLERDHLGCPEAWPRRPRDIRGVDAPARVLMTCSGKHAGFLAATVRAGGDPARYLDRESPVQREVSSVIEELAGEPVAHWGVDGCLAPTPILSLEGFARAIGRALRERPELLDAARTAPWAIDEERGENARVIAETGFFAKTGAEGVMVMTLPTGETVVTKALDGSERLGTPVALEILARAGLVARETVNVLLAEVSSPNLRVAI